MITILMYHQLAEVSRKLDPRGLAVPPAQFEQQMRYLAHNGYLCLSLAEAVRYIKNDGHTPAKSFVITFDDGYQDVHTKACPILEQFGFTATVFLVADRMGARSKWWGQEGEQSGALLTYAEARDLAQRGFILGSHTLNHPYLTKLDDQSAFDEIRNSKVKLQDQLDLQIDYFSYPYSNTDPRIEKLVESAGYTAACAVDSGPWSIFHLWRIPCLKYDSPLSFALKINGWYEKRTALRESALGLILRRSVRRFRRRLFINHANQPALINHDLNIKKESHD